MPTKRTALKLALAASLAFATPAIAQTRFPERAVQIIAPYAPGGAADVFARLIAKELEGRLGQPVIVVNRPGGGTIIGAQAVLTAPADGYTLFLTSNSTFTLNPAVVPNLPYDSAKDFEPIAQLATIVLALVTYTENPTKDVASLVAAAKAEPDKLAMASFGNATVSHFAGEWFKSVAGIKMVHVPYRGSNPAMNDLIGRHVPFLIDTVVAAKPQIDDGKIRALAVTTAKRSTMLPDVPTLQELGYKDVDLSSWVTLVTAKGVPAEIRAKLATAVEDAMRNPALLARISRAGFEPAYEKYTDWPGKITKEIADMKAIAQAANIKGE
jgi:tripartite-type tricarboxylate transporter receptor subunit TctC